MKLLCIATLLLSAEAARPDSWRPWQDEKLSPEVGNKLDADYKRGDGEQSVTHAPEHGDEGSGGEWPEGDSGYPVWLPPWLQNTLTTRPGNGNPQGPRNNWDQALGFMPDQHGELRSGLRRHFGRPSKRPNMRNPIATGKLVFSPTFKVDNVTFQNVTAIPLKEGENLFLMPKRGGRGPHHHRGDKHGPPMNVQYVKLVYNATEPNKVSVEYGVLKPMNFSELVGEEDYDEGEDVW